MRFSGDRQFVRFDVGSSCATDLQTGEVHTLPPVRPMPVSEFLRGVDPCGGDCKGGSGCTCDPEF